MLKLKILVPMLLGITTAMAQANTPKTDTAARKVSDSLVSDLKEGMLDNIPTVSLDENDLGDGGSQSISSVLTAGRDPFFSAASFNFSAARFRIRAYDNDLNTTFMNGIPMDNLDNGFTPFGLWGGLNDVMRNRDVSIGLRYNTFAFGDIASSANIDSRASKQRKQTQFGYAISNRNYTHRFTFSHSSGMSKKGWAYSVAGSFRGASEGYVPGTFYNGYSYFIGVDKRFNQRHMLSLIAFNALTENGRQGASVAEMQELSGDRFYNPNWGYQNGKKRNASVGKTNQPFIILTHDFRLSGNTSLVTAAGYSFGDRSTTALDWYNSADPRPDYYRYLPSYYTDPAIHQQMQQLLSSNEGLRQINWDRLYDVNRNNFASIQNANGIQGNTISGRRSLYIVEDRIINTKRFNFNTVLNSRIGNHVDFTAGASYQSQKNHYYKKVDDLLGGDFYVNVNQFAERDFPTDPNASQNDINNPNRILKVGDKFGYDYDIQINRAAAWAQGVFKFNKVDFFAAVEVSNTQFWRVGNVRSGLFPNTSFGKSTVNNFTNYAVKGGVTYKINGRNYFYLNGAYLTRAPFFENAYLSPRTRDVLQGNLVSETVQTIEGGYVLNAPNIKFRISGYTTRFDNQVNVLTFYHDEFRNFVNYGLSNIDKIHFGGELGFEVKVLPGWTVNGAASVGRAYYDSRQNAQITQDNSSTDLGKTLIYSQNFRVSGTPQEAYSLGVQYRSPNYWFAGLTGNYFDQMWLDFNPISRTYEALQDLDHTSKEYFDILNQQRLPGQTTLDFFAGYSWKLPRSLGLKKATFLVFNVGVNNLLDNQDMITGGFEQLRYDYVTNNVGKFPPKYFYAYGLNYFASATLRF
jgi:hypothetical protein